MTLVNSRLCICSFLIFSHLTAQALPVKTFEGSQNWPQALDLESNASVSGLSKISQIKWYQNKSNFKKCTTLSESLSSETRYGIWITYVHLSCLKSWMSRDSKLPVSTITRSFALLAKRRGELLQSPIEVHGKKLLDVYLQIADTLAERARGQLSDFIDEYGDLNDHLNKRQRAAYYKILGEVAWLTQKNQLAVSNFLRSYEFRSDPSVLKRLKTLKAEASLDLDKYTRSFTESSAESQLWKKFSSASRKGQTYKVADYGSDFLNQYPGSERVETVRDDISSVFKRLLYRRGRKYESVKKDFEKQLMKAPAQHLFHWAEVAYGRGYHESSYRLGAIAVEKWEGENEAAPALLLTARSAMYLVKRSKARKLLDRLIRYHSGHEAASEGQYLLGLLYYREGDYAKVISLYDQFLQSESSDPWELQVRYWLYRALKKMDSKRSSEVAQALLKEFPLTYYGLRVRVDEKMELRGFVAKEVAKVESSFWWPSVNSERWQRVKRLIEAGWVEEAETEIDFLPDPQVAEGFLVRAQIWNAAGLSYRAIKDYAAAIDRDPRYITQNMLEFAFPQKFQAAVEKAEKEFSISKNLVWSIMRQESAFMPRAVSPSRAYGLMQLLSPTAKETARWLKVKKFKMPYDIFKPEINVRFGAHFISRMARKYKTVVPLAIASYNVGPGNLDRWLSHREDLKDWEKIGASPDDDMWMDELPWAETSFYVKAVMRNYLLYKIIHEKIEALPSPPWEGAKL